MDNPWLNEIITPEDRRQIDEAVQSMCEVLIVGTVLCENITDFIDARMGGHEGEA